MCTIFFYRYSSELIYLIFRRFFIFRNPRFVLYHPQLFHLCLTSSILIVVWQAAKMKQILVSQTVKVPEGVSVKVNARRVTVVGPRGKLARDFKHLALDMQVIG